MFTCVSTQHLNKQANKCRKWTIQEYGVNSGQTRIILFSKTPRPAEVFAKPDSQ